MKFAPVRGMAAVLACLLLACVAARPDDEGIFRCGDEVIVGLGPLDLFRQSHRRLRGAIGLAGAGGERLFDLDLADPVVPASVAIDVSGYGACTSLSVEVTGDGGTLLYSRRVSPVPVVREASDLPPQEGQTAAVEPGSAIGARGAPRILLPDASRLRHEAPAAPRRSVTASRITSPVVAETDFPLLASANYVLISRQSFAPDDETRCSLYFSYRKAIYDTAGLRLKKWRKFLVEVPLQPAWLEGQGDEIRTLPLDAFTVHATEEPSPRGANMLGDSQNGLAQGGQSAETDERGRIYFSNLSDGAGLVRFDPSAGRFEQPPVDFGAELRKLIPGDERWKRSWDTDLGELLCARGRVFILFARNYRTRTPNGDFETCSGVVSVPQDGWHDAAAFRAGIRLHAGSWAGAQHRLYDSEVPIGVYTRKALAPIETREGLFFASAPGCKGGPWRLDLDAQGNTRRLTSGGAALQPADTVTTRGLPKQRLINVGAAVRPLLHFGCGELEITRAALALILPSAPREHLVDGGGRFRTTFEGAPPGTLTIRFDVTAKIRAGAAQHGELASSLSGPSLGPGYCVTPIPGEPGRAIGVCEYGYHLSTLDFTRLETERRVLKTPLPLLCGGEKTGLPVAVGLGPYNAAWAEHDGALWLYLVGYTGMARVRYAEAGRTLQAFTSEMFYRGLAPQPLDGRPRSGIKDYLHLMPAMDGRMIDIGRGRPGRGGGAFSAGLEVFSPTTLGKSGTLVWLSRCYGLHTPESRLVLSASHAPPRQEIYVASSPIRQEYVDDLADSALVPASRDPKLFVYDCETGGSLRDRYGFALPSPLLGADGSVDIAFSPCRQYLVMLQHGGAIYSYRVAGGAFTDGLRLQSPAGEPMQPIEFSRPSAFLWSAPNGRIFLLAAPEGPASRSVSFYEVTASPEGRLAVRPHLAIILDGNSRVSDFAGVVRCFLPDLVRRDGSYDFVLGGNQENGGPTVRVIDDFIPPDRSPLR